MFTIRLQRVAVLAALTLAGCAGKQEDPATSRLAAGSRAIYIGNDKDVQLARMKPEGTLVGAEVTVVRDDQTDSASFERRVTFRAGTAESGYVTAVPRSELVPVNSR